MLAMCCGLMAGAMKKTRQILHREVSVFFKIPMVGRMRSAFSAIHKRAVWLGQALLPAVDVLFWILKFINGIFMRLLMPLGLYEPALMLQRSIWASLQRLGVCPKGQRPERTPTSTAQSFALCLMLISASILGWWWWGGGARLMAQHTTQVTSYPTTTPTVYLLRHAVVAENATSPSLERASSPAVAKPPATLPPPRTVALECRRKASGRARGKARAEAAGGEGPAGAGKEPRCWGTGKEVAPECKPNKKTELKPIGASVTAKLGAGGPSGCAEAWVTLLEQDRQLPGLLVLLHTLRKYGSGARDVVVLVAKGVSPPILDLLSAQCVVVRPFKEEVVKESKEEAAADGKKPGKGSRRYQVHRWVVRLFMWTLEEYSKIVYIEPDTYFVKNPDALFCGPDSPRVLGMQAINTSAAAAANDSSAAGIADIATHVLVVTPSRSFFEELAKIFETLPFHRLRRTTGSEFLKDVLSGKANFLPKGFVTVHEPFAAPRGPGGGKARAQDNALSIHGYNIAGELRPWSKAWLKASKERPQKIAMRSAPLYVEWWGYYYELTGRKLPSSLEALKLLPEHEFS
eukprot:jgi/Mesvir1/23612/Mv18294-RA.1